MMSQSCSKLRFLRCIFCQIEYGVFSRPTISASRSLLRSVSRSCSMMRGMSTPPCSRRKFRRATIEFARVRVELGERQILELVLHLLHADALGQRRVDVHRLAGDAPALLVVVEELQRAHVVQPVGQLDQQHADVLGHRQHQLAEVLRLPRVLRLQLDAGELGDAVDQARHLGAEQTARSRRWWRRCPRRCRAAAR